MALNSTPATAARNIARILRNSPRRITAQFIRHTSSSSSSPLSSTSSVSSDELKHFASLASSWWDPLGPSRILHLMNPVRHDFIASCLADSQQLPPNASNRTSPTTDRTPASPSHPNPKRGLKYLDVGCGGGIFAESLARTIPQTDDTASTQSSRTQASSLLAIDPSPAMINLALSHARQDPTLYSHLQTGKFKYENTSLEDLDPNTSSSEPGSTTTSQFDIVTIFEVLEHVDPRTSSPRSFLEQCLRLVAPGGWLIGSTIARTWASYVVNQVVAEAPWPVGVVPRGTHEWGKFVNADEVKGWVEGALMATRSASEEQRGDMSKAYPGMGWKCVGAMYVPGLGWKLVPGAETWGNYFWGVQKME